jgi:hypothetical protein
MIHISSKAMARPSNTSTTSPTIPAAATLPIPLRNNTRDTKTPTSSKSAMASSPGMASSPDMASTSSKAMASRSNTARHSMVSLERLEALLKAIAA